MDRVTLNCTAAAQGYGRAPPRASHKAARLWLFGALLASLLGACQTVSVSTSPAPGGETSLKQDKLRAAANALLARAARGGWAPSEGESLADILLNGRDGAPESIDAVEAYLARGPANGAALRARLEGDATSARVAAAQLSEELVAILAQGDGAPSRFEEDLRLMERAIIYLKRGESVFSAASARLEPSARPDSAPPPAAAAWELELLRAEIRRLTDEIDRLARQVMQQQIAPN